MIGDVYHLPANLKRRPDHEAATRADRAAAVSKLKSLGIKPLAAFSSGMMDATAQPKEPGHGRGNWRDGPRQVARRNGLTRYWGRPCKHSHQSPRYVSTGQCVACVAMWAAAERASLSQT